MRLDRIVVEMSELSEILEDAHYRVSRLLDTQEIFSSDIKIRRKIQGTRNGLTKAVEYLTGASEMYRYQKEDNF